MFKKNKIYIYKVINIVFVTMFSLFISSNLFAQNNGGMILLTTPTNEQQIEVSYPLFSWASTLSFSSISNVTYVIKIVEVYSYQTATTAILANPTLYEKEVGTATILQYPIDAPELQSCKKYAWQVTAYDKTKKIVGENNYKITYTNKIAQSEPYLFFAKCDQAQSRISNPSSTQPYIVLAKTVDNFVFKIDANKKLNIKYIEEYAHYTLKYKIYNWKRDVIATDLTVPIPLDYGWNYLTIDLSGLNPSVLPTGSQNIYQLEVETPKGDIYKAKFEITQ